MSARDQIAAAEATLAALNDLADAEEAAAAAKAAYRADPTNPELKAAHRAWSAALIAAREAWGDATGSGGVALSGDVYRSTDQES